MPNPNFLIRRAETSDWDAIQTLVQAVADETFSDLFSEPHVPIGNEDWSCGWVAVSNCQIIGVTLTRAEYLVDLWVAADWRRQGVGGGLLAQGERETKTRGYSFARLRVVKSNSRAIEFYLRQRWMIAREFPHEKFKHDMFEMTKSLD